MEDKINKEEVEIQRVSVDVGGDYICTVFRGRIRIEAYAFYLLNTWGEEDAENIYSF